MPGRIAARERQLCLVFIGPTCAGKTTAARHVETWHHAFMFEASAVIKRLSKIEGVKSETPSAMARVLFQLKGSDVAAKSIAESIRGSRKTRPIVISGLRFSGELRTLRAKLVQRIVVIYIEAPEPLRLQRYILRDRRGDDISSVAELRAIDNEPFAGSRRLTVADSDSVIYNVGTKREFYDDIDEALSGY